MLFGGYTAVLVVQGGWFINLCLVCEHFHWNSYTSHTLQGINLNSTLIHVLKQDNVTLFSLAFLSPWTATAPRLCRGLTFHVFSSSNAFSRVFGLYIKH